MSTATTLTTPPAPYSRISPPPTLPTASGIGSSATSRKSRRHTLTDKASHTDKHRSFKWWQVRGDGNLVSRLVTQAYFERQCGLFFPKEGEYTYGIAEGKTTANVNEVTGGWYNVNTHRLQWAAGEFDPWRPATVMATTRPGGQLQSTAAHPVRVIPGGAHCGDQLTFNAQANAALGTIFAAEVATIKQWVGEFYAEKGKNHY